MDCLFLFLVKPVFRSTEIEINISIHFQLSKCNCYCESIKAFPNACEKFEGKWKRKYCVKNK